jgi:hypothetical protein
MPDPLTDAERDEIGRRIDPFNADPAPAGLSPVQALRFVAQIAVDAPGACWLWCGETNNRGYGRFTIYRENGRKRFLSHRLAWSFAGGDPAVPVVRHSCDTPPCCNPAHLLPGTQQDNMRDATERGRMNLRGLEAGRKSRAMKGRQFERCRSGRHVLAETARYRKAGRFCGACLDDRLARQREDRNRGKAR